MGFGRSAGLARLPTGRRKAARDEPRTLPTGRVGVYPEVGLGHKRMRASISDRKMTTMNSSVERFVSLMMRSAPGERSWWEWSRPTTHRHPYWSPAPVRRRRAIQTPTGRTRGQHRSLEPLTCCDRPRAIRLRRRIPSGTWCPRIGQREQTHRTWGLLGSGHASGV